ncbi:P-loop NTPase [Altererythrobacter aquaemixtae]|uniref:Iron-sulfur cluster carrier protein n=2 Tax=Pontixanthobacter aquaemixtae TaxID=1958940 RepID=A0A844ZR01_9SPHN|nr:Mrp/NBP35 family ATP-binding protein [Pontixanthobacter aquaemixtae]MXO89237.1 P-loop NTPase [Pontixanthobacter aquaemixtae]
MDEQALKARLPDSVAARVQSIKLENGRATLVLDASGLEPENRDGLESAVKQIIGEADGVGDVRVAMVADRAPPQPGPTLIAVGSGKGGVGKSTLTANLAVALARLGRKVGIVDADVYGPSQPTILNNKGQKPEARDDKLVPVPSPHGIPLLSMGHLVEPGVALAWRGPMAGNAMAQLIDAHWDGTEVLLIDLPPGTGDVQLTMLSKFKPAGAVIVSTPQDLALIDAQRAANLFDSGKVPIIGLVENMSGYACPSCGEVSDPFGKGGVEAAADATGIPFLGRIPLAMEIRTASDNGTPSAAGDGHEAEPFHAVAKQLADWLDTQPVGGQV